MTDQDKPFKTIEVVDGQTRQLCKVACMSCIRGHRTTSCGSPVCQPKIFWTVKRPGRPSNSCTCRYGSAGGCKCVTAISKCPHKSKKGEKRSSECRCDEQGRFCCTLEPMHWEALYAKQAPSVFFHPSREVLEAQQQHSRNASVATPGTPSYGSMTPQRTGSCCGTPTPQTQQRNTPVHIAPNTYDGPSTPQSSSLTSIFSTMGVGTPNGLMGGPQQDNFAWMGAPTIAARDYHTPTYDDIEPETPSCCKSISPPQQLFDTMQHLRQPSDQNIINPLDPQGFQDLPQLSSQPVFDFDRWTQNYHAYQMPGAICQKCGLNGCTCRNCPPVMQNYGTTSWAQGCGRAHARMGTMTPAPVSQFQHPMSTMPTSNQHSFIQAPVPGPDSMDTNALPFGFDVNAHGQPLQHDFIMPDGTDPVSFSDFLMSELDRPSHTPDQNGYG